MRCPRCGGKASFIERLGFMDRYGCRERECQNTFTVQVKDVPEHVQIAPDQLPDRR